MTWAPAPGASRALRATGPHRPPGRLWALWFLLPLTLWEVVFYLIPIGLMMLASVWTMNQYRLAPTWTLHHYAVFFTDPVYYKAYLTSLRFAVVTVLVTVVLAYPFAYGLAFLVPPRVRVVALIAVVAPFWTNYLVRGYSWQIVLAPSGPLNYVLQRLHLTHAPVHVLYSLAAARIGLVHFLLAIMTLMLYTTLENIDQTLLEAAADLGAGRLRTFLEVILPLSLPGLVAGTMFVFVFAFADFISPAVLGGQAQRVFPQVIVDAVQWTVDWPQGASFAVIMTATILGVVAALGWVGRRWRPAWTSER